MKLTFYGGAKSVTGANYLLEEGDLKILIDCGLFQGSKYAEELNYTNFSYDPSTIDYLLVTHSHIDHVGRIPKLYRDGFRGVLMATRATLDLIAVALPDNMELIKEEAKRDSHEPLFKTDDLNNVLTLGRGVDYGEVIRVGEGVEIKFMEAGHILGSAVIEIVYATQEGSKKIYFSGDLGNPPTPLLNLPYEPKDADYMVIESAYGSRIHEDRAERKQILIDTIEETIKRGGTLMIPSFAIERTQELLYELNNLVNENKISPVPVFVDSPLAVSITAVYRKYLDYFNQSTKYIIDSGDDIFNFPGLVLTRTTSESKKINDIVGPKIIIAGSGMSVGGRILHHEYRYLPDPNSTVLIIGYQVEGSPGRRILDGEKTIKIFGETVPINCHVKAIGGYSAHADQATLFKWVSGSAGKLKKVFVVQGEEEAADVLAQKITSELSTEAIVPGITDSFDLI